MKKLLSVILVLATLVGVIMIAPVSSSAYSIPNESEFLTKLNQLRSKYPNGGTYSGTYYENGEAKAWTCHGYACQMIYEVFGVKFYNDGLYNQKSYTMGTIYAGDLIRLDAGAGYGSHSVFVTKVTSDRVYFTDGNYDNKNGIRWDASYTKTELANRFAYKVHLSGNTLTGNGTPAPHTHSYNTYVYFWKSHPHYKCYKCSCGEVKERSTEPTFLSTCTTCKDNLGLGFFAKITNPQTGLALTLTSNDNVVYQTYTSDDSQIWHFARSDDGSYIIRNIGTSKYIDVNGGSSANGTNVQGFGYNGSNAQHWYLTKANVGYSLISKLGNVAIEMASGGTATSTNAQIYAWNYTAAQKVYITKVDTGLVREHNPEDFGEEFNAQIYKASGGNIIGTNNNNVVINSKDTTLWHFVRQADSSSRGAEYKIYYGTTGKCMSLSSDTVNASSKVVIADDKNANTQRWYIVKIGNNYFLANKGDTNFLFTIEGNSEKDLASVSMGEYKNFSTPAQQLAINIVKATPDRLLGDVDGDGSVTITDATLIQMYLAKLRTLDNTALAAAETDGDGKVSITDATMIQLYLAKLIDKLG